MGDPAMAQLHQVAHRLPGPDFVIDLHGTDVFGHPGIEHHKGELLFRHNVQEAVINFVLYHQEHAIEGALLDHRGDDPLGDHLFCTHHFQVKAVAVLR